MYLISISVFFFLGGLIAVGVRLELATPQGDFVSADTYNKLFTLHGVIMVFFFLIPSIPATLGNFLIPPMIGAKDLAFPRINLLSLYIYWLGGIFTLYALIDRRRRYRLDLLHAVQRRGLEHQRHSDGAGRLHRRLLVDPDRAQLHRHHPPDARAGHDVVPAAAVRVGALRHQPGSGARHAGHRDHDPDALRRARLRLRHLRPARGGDPVLFQHLFWFYSHPAVYIMILPALGVQSELIANFSRKKIFGYSFVAFSRLAIAMFGFIVWAHHMFVSGISVYAAMVFSFLSFSVAIPSAVKVFNWTATLYKGSISFETPMLYAYGFMGLFTIGGLTGLVPGDARHRHPPARHVLRGRALPLHHGGRRDHGLPGRPALLVAEDDRPDVLRVPVPDHARSWCSSDST